jgi:large subunit ribosomal protein L37Ae
MSKRTKKVGSTGRYQARYGVRSRTRIRNVEIQQKINHLCPNCKYEKLKRTDTGIWQCKKCGAKIAGGSYIPTTEAGEHIVKLLKGETEIIKDVNKGEKS